MRVNEHIRYEPEDRTPLPMTLGVALQGCVLALSNSITIATTFIVASGGSPAYASWAVFAALIAGGAATALQAARLGRLGSGHLLLMGPAAPFIAVCALAAAHDGFQVMSSLVVAASVAQFALAFWLPRLRRIITPTVSGVALMVISASVMPIAMDKLDSVPTGLPPLAGPVVGGVTLAAAAVLMLRGWGLLSMMALPATILIGCAAAALLGVYDVSPALEAPWVALPEFQAWPGLVTVYDSHFLALLPVFLIVSAVVAVKASNEGAAIQQVSQRRPRAVDFRRVQGTLHAGGVGVLLSGLLGIVPALIYLPSSMSLVTFTGTAARRTGFVIGGMLIALALMPKVVAIILTIPKPVTGAVLIVLMGLLFMEGARSLFQDGFNRQKAAVAGFSLSIAIGLQSRNILSEALGSPWDAAFGSSVVAGVLAAVLMSAVLDMTVSRRRRMEAELDMSALPNIDNFLRDLGARMGWNQTSIERLCAAGEETLSSMLQLRDDYEEGRPPRLVLIARPRAGTVEMEFLAVSQEENIEDRIAYMSEQAEAPDVSEISFRLLRHYASSVRHRKYHGIDVVTVQVDG